MLLKIFINWGPIILLLLIILFKKKLVTFPRLLFFKIISAVFIGGIGIPIWYFRLVFNCTADIVIACGGIFVLVAPALAVIGTLLAYMLLEVILGKSQDSQKHNRNPILEGISSFLAFAVSAGVGIIFWNFLSDKDIFGSTYDSLIVALADLMLIVWIFITLRKVFRRIRRAVGIKI